MNELAIIPRGIAEVDQLAEKLSKSALLPTELRNKPQDIMFQIMTGSELGLGPIASIRGIYIIQGKPTLSADTMVALCLGSGHCDYFVQTEASATSVTFETKRKGAPVAQKVTWTIEDAKRAGIATNPTWRLYPRQMLSSRAKAELARMAYPDILAGCYDPEEIESTPLRTEQPKTRTAEPEAVDAEIVTESMDDLAKLCEAAGSIAELVALKERCAALPNGPKRTLTSEAYKARLAQLKVETAA